MNLQDVFKQKKLTASIEDSKKLIFERQVFINNKPATTLYTDVRCGDIIKVGKIEIVVVSKHLKGLQTR